MQSFTEWLREVGLERYSAVFAEHGVDFNVAGDLSDEELRGLGLTLGDRKRLLQALAASAPPAPKPSSRSPEFPTGSAEPVAPSGERRQLTVLFCDLVGSTELSRRLDPEDYRDLVQRYQSACAEIVSRFEGHIAQYLGDGLLVYFGFPLAHEDDAQRAVRAGLGLVEAVARVDTPSGPLAARVGIHTGLIVVGDVGSGNVQERLALGDTPNLAARLQALAAPSSVVLSDQTRRLMGGGFELRDCGAHALKGVVELVQVWQAIGARDAESRFEDTTRGRPAPMVGRELEFAVVLHAWARARSGKGQMVLLCGEPGIGKSRILRALREEVTGEGVSVLQHQCSPYFVNSALFPVVTRLERTLEFGREDSPQERLDKLERALQDLGRPALDVNLIGRLLSLPVEARYGLLSMTPQKQKDETIRVLNDIVATSASSRPLLMVFEDAHWADPTTLELLETLLARLNQLRVLLIVTYRPEFKPQWVGQAHVTALTLSRLDPEHTKTIATRAAGGRTLPEEISAQIAAKTDGIPLFVEELTKAIVESGLLQVRDGRFELSGPLPALAIPVTLRDSLMARLDRLAPVKEVAQAGACIGREFEQELLELILPLSTPQLGQALDTLIASELVFRRGQAPATRYVFKHALIQEAAYDSLLKSKRVQLHAQIAEALETHFPETLSTRPELIAHHYTAAHLPEMAILHWHKAGELAFQRFALRDAIAHLEHGLTLLQQTTASHDRDQRELPLRTTLGLAWLALGGYAHPEVGSQLGRAWELEETIDGEAHSLPVLWGLWVYRMCRGQVRESLAWGARLLNQAARNDNEDMRLAAFCMRAGSYYFLGEFARAVEDNDIVLLRYDAVRNHHFADLLNHDPKTTASVHKGDSEWMLGYPDRAARTVEDGVEHARRRGHPFDLHWALHFSAMQLHTFRREPELLAAKLDECERVVQDQSLFLASVAVPIGRAICLLLCGRAEEAQAQFREQWHLVGTLIPELQVPYLKALHAQSLALLGRLEPASELLEEALEQIERPGWEERFSLAEVLRTKGWVLSLKGDLEGAEHCYRTSLDWARKQQAKSWELRTSTSYARMMRAQGRHTEALQLLQPVYDWFTEGRSTKDHLEAAALLAELRHGMPERSSDDRKR